MRISARHKSTSAAVAAILLCSAVSVIAAAGPAAADSPLTGVDMTSLAYTDSLVPKQSFENPSGDLPLGSWTDAGGATHMSRVYATFDLSTFTGEDITSAVVGFTESKVTDCQARTVQIWQTKTPTYQVTWHHAPDEETLLGTVGGSTTCPGTFSLDLTTAIHDAVAAHRPNLSIELRLPAADEGNLALGRWIRNPSLGMYLKDDTAPTKPTELFNDARPCVTSKPYPALGETTPSLWAMFGDPDSYDFNLTGDFAVWPVDDSANRTEFTSPYTPNGFERQANVPSGVLVDGGTYAWQARTDDGTLKSAWTKPCYFTVDTSRPNVPIITSSYPQGQFAPGGTPGTFTFSANGSSDVTAYQYTWLPNLGVPVYTIGPKGVPQWTDPFDQAGFVRADKLGGSATVTLVPPNTFSILTVRSFTKSYNVSDTTTYRVFVTDTEPTVTASATPKYKVPFTLTFAPNPALTGVESYTYQVDNAAAQTVPAGADGTATVPVTFSTPFGHTVTVRSNSANGWVSSPNVWFANIQTAPTITSDIYAEDVSSYNPNGGVGVTGTFTFTSNVPDAVSVTYSFDWSGETTIPLDANGTARVQWTPDVNGSHVVYAYVTGADGTVFDTYYYYFDVN